MNVSMPHIASQSTPAKGVASQPSSHGKFAGTLLEALGRVDETASQKLPGETSSHGGPVRGGRKSDSKAAKLDANPTLTNPDLTNPLMAQPLKCGPSDATLASILSTASTPVQKEAVRDGHPGREFAEFLTRATDPKVLTPPTAAGSSSAEGKTHVSHLAAIAEGSAVSPALTAAGPQVSRDGTFGFTTHKPGQAEESPAGPEIAQPRVPYLPAQTHSEVGLTVQHGVEDQHAAASSLKASENTKRPDVDLALQALFGLEAAGQAAAATGRTVAPEPRTGSRSTPHPPVPHAELKDGAGTGPSRAREASAQLPTGSQPAESTQRAAALERFHSISNGKAETTVVQSSGGSHKSAADGGRGDEPRPGKEDSTLSGVTTGPKSVPENVSQNIQPSSQGPSFAAAMQTAVASVGGQGSNNSMSAPRSEGLSAAHGQKLARIPDEENTAETTAVHSYSVFQAARLVERIGQSELHVGIQAGEFGKVDIRTSLAHHQFTAEISVERPELGRVLAAELPNLHGRLTEQQLPHTNIILQQHAGDGSTGSRQDWRQTQNFAPSHLGPAGEHEDWMAQVMAAEAWEAPRGLDIHL